MNQKPPAADPTDRVMKIPPIESPHHEEALLDQAVAETFPASDPISPASAALMEPADVNYESLADQSSNFRERLRRSTPALIAIGTAAVALLAMYALRGGRSARRGGGSDYE